MKPFHLFAVTPVAGSSSVSMVLYSDFMVLDESLEGAYAQIKERSYPLDGNWNGKKTSMADAAEVWGGEYGDTIITSPGSQPNALRPLEQHRVWCSGQLGYSLLHRGPVSLESHPTGRPATQQTQAAMHASNAATQTENA